MLGRRALLTGIATAPLAVRSKSTAVVQCSNLQVGDLIVGSSGSVMRVAQTHRLANGRIRVRVTSADISDGSPVAIEAKADEAGYGAHKRFVRLLQHIPKDAVQLDSPATPGRIIIDGGTP